MLQEKCYNFPLTFEAVFIFSTDQPSAVLSVDPSKTIALAGQTVSFECHYRDGPQIAIFWMKKGGTLPVGRHSSSQYGKLMINNVQAEDEGAYTCNVRTGAGLLTASATLVVHCKC